MSAITEFPSFLDLMNRLRDGDDVAASEVFDRFTQRLIAKARSRMSEIVKQKVDPEDVVQSAYRTFFWRAREGQFELVNWDSLWGLLVVITLRKCGRQVDRFHAGRRDVFRETPAAAHVTGEGPIILDRQPTPEEIVSLMELVQGVLEPMSEKQREIVALSLQGYERNEVAEMTGASERTVRRVLRFIRDSLERDSEKDCD